jgi:ABC-type sugar transport system substrate-binding protein
MKAAKILSLVALSTLSLLVLAGCVSPAVEVEVPVAEEMEEVEVEAEAETEAEAPAEEEMASTGAECAPNCTYEDLVVGFLQTGSEGGWRAANSASFRETAEELGVTLKFYDSQNDLARQIAGFRNFIEDDEVNVIILAALEAAGWEEVLQEAQDAGKIVVLEDRRIDASEDLYATYVGSDFVLEGRRGGDEMCALLEGSDSKNVVELVGNVGSSAAIDRGAGFRETMEACGITITESQTGNWSATEGKAVMEAWLTESTDIQGVFAQNDEMGLGAAQAIEEAGLVPGEDIKIITFDATAGAFTAMLDGTINVSVECNPLLAPQVYEAALAALNGEELPKWVPSQESVFRATDENLEEIAAGRAY